MSDDTPSSAAMRAVLETERWWDEPAAEQALRAPLLRACAMYLTQAAGREGPLDPVARFHLRNGARLEQVNWRGNVAPRGIKEAYGIMVNYLYDLPTIEANHEAFARDGTIARSAGVDALMTPQPAPRSLGRLSRTRGD